MKQQNDYYGRFGSPMGNQVSGRKKRENPTAFWATLLLLAMAFVLPLVASAQTATTGNDYSDNSYVQLYGDIYEDLMNTKKMSYKIFQLNDITCEWRVLEFHKNLDYYNIVLDPTMEHEIIFFGKRFIKVIHIKPGYNGIFSYRIDVNFATSLCISMTPTLDKGSFDIDYITLDQLQSIDYCK